MENVICGLLGSCWPCGQVWTVLSSGVGSVVVGTSGALGAPPQRDGGPVGVSASQAPPSPREGTVINAH